MSASSARMNAAVARAGRHLDVEPVAKPEPGPGEVRVRVGACGICGSDLHLRELGVFAPGHTPGHEIAGLVDSSGEGVEGWTAGDPVAIEPFLTCGRCPECRSGRDPLCRQGRLLGIHAPGGMAEYVVVPAERLFRGPADLDLATLALAEPLAVSIHGLRRGGFQPGWRVLVLGAGSVGLLTLLAARALGAGEVWITARHDHQAQRARALGARRVLTEKESGPDALEALGRREAVDLVVETVGGHAQTLRDGAAAVRPGGAVVVLGVFTRPVSFETMPFLLKEVSLVWSYCYHHPRPTGAGTLAAGGRPEFCDAIEVLDREREGAQRLLSHRIPLGEVERAFALAADKRGGAIKVSVVP